MPHIHGSHLWSGLRKLTSAALLTCVSPNSARRYLDEHDHQAGRSPSSWITRFQ
jgi:hypothetical protein